MPFTNSMGRTSGPTKRWAWSSIHLVWYPASVFAENWLYCVGLLELCGYIHFVNFTNCPRICVGHCMYGSLQLRYGDRIKLCRLRAKSVEIRSGNIEYSQKRSRVFRKIKDIFGLRSSYRRPLTECTRYFLEGIGLFPIISNVFRYLH